ncbi:hypothetical protein [Pseudonocardia lacus]|uniref:hypothetical protein n=1 Tax=Pseudonocardia lacus TaxID=2835865 RepID=UPI001BDD3E2E|nr:hypothetical protein [Pseudonocardia lacus]
MHVMTVSRVHDPSGFDGALKGAYGALPAGSRWILAVAGGDGTTVVNVVEHGSVEAFRAFLEPRTAPYATTDYVEADAANAVGLPG